MTEKQVRYSNAPITEAVIDLRAAQPSGLSISDLQKLARQNEEQYPIVGEQYVYRGEGYLEQVGAPLQQESQHWHNGFRCTSGDRRRTFYAQLDGFAFSVRAPYEGWARFRNEARRLWEAYKVASGAMDVTRVAVRYINRIDIPRREDGGVTLEHYIKVYPEVPSNFPPDGGTMNMFFLQVQIPQLDIGSMSIINATPEASPSEQIVSVTLDLDLFREELEEPWEAENDENIWSFLEKLHERKNEIFEASITDRTRRLIQ